MLDQSELDRLREFHAAHFPGRPIPVLHKPDQIPATTTSLESATNEHDNTPLGYYEDGTKRTLTDVQVQMFRHSEIERLLQERRLAKRRNQKNHPQRRNLHRHTRVELEPRTVAHADDPTLETAVDTLAYDDEPTPDPALTQPPNNNRPVFLWPQIANK